VNEHGQRVLSALDEIAAAHDAPVAAVSLAWLLAKPTVAAPIASARTVAQLDELMPMATLKLNAEDIRRLDAASRST
jgi:aryl-alcohol dehydrogenase-like predicted oxidoreductase